MNLYPHGNDGCLLRKNRPRTRGKRLPPFAHTEHTHVAQQVQTMRARAHTHTRTHTHTHARAHTHTHMYTHAHTHNTRTQHTHTHTHGTPEQSVVGVRAYVMRTCCGRAYKCGTRTRRARPACAQQSGDVQASTHGHQRSAHTQPRFRKGDDDMTLPPEIGPDTGPEESRDGEVGPIFANLTQRVPTSSPPAHAFTPARTHTHAHTRTHTSTHAHSQARACARHVATARRAPFRRPVRTPGCEPTRPGVRRCPRGY